MRSKTFSRKKIRDLKNAQKSFLHGKKSTRQKHTGYDKMYEIRGIIRGFTVFMISMALDMRKTMTSFWTYLISFSWQSVHPKIDKKSG